MGSVSGSAYGTCGDAEAGGTMLAGQIGKISQSRECLSRVLKGKEAFTQRSVESFLNFYHDLSSLPSLIPMRRSEASAGGNNKTICTVSALGEIRRRFALSEIYWRQLMLGQNNLVGHFPVCTFCLQKIQRLGVLGV